MCISGNDLLGLERSPMSAKCRLLPSKEGTTSETKNGGFGSAHELPMSVKEHGRLCHVQNCSSVLFFSSNETET